MIRELPDENATLALGAALAAILRPGDIVALDGPLGAGKTTLVRAVARSLGVDARLVSSPTFVFVNQYPIPAASPNSSLAAGQLVHIDAYRLTSREDLDSLGWDRLFDSETGTIAGRAAAMLEWPSKIAGAMADEALALVEIEPTGEYSRRVRLVLPHEWSTRGLDALTGWGAS